ncbi:hypothetical protein F5Y18DRAFT_387792 [Xylariaceae sp. FL1019]|nr:hypothetical protein F5Y18DRAFT_387792 [Xylariaceae sp. FL1019]
MSHHHFPSGATDFSPFPDGQNLQSSCDDSATGQGVMQSGSRSYHENYSGIHSGCYCCNYPRSDPSYHPPEGWSRSQDGGSNSSAASLFLHSEPISGLNAPLSWANAWGDTLRLSAVMDTITILSSKVDLYSSCLSDVQEKLQTMDENIAAIQSSLAEMQKQHKDNSVCLRLLLDLLLPEREHERHITQADSEADADRVLANGDPVPVVNMHDLDGQ